MRDSLVRIENRGQLIYMLSEAAELEHGIMCCYLYCAFTMKRDVSEGVTEEQLASIQRWRRTIMNIAVEEMLHMCLACNLLTAVGGAPHLRRPNLPSSPKAYPPSFRLALAPFNRESLATFVFIERPLDMVEADMEAEGPTAHPLQTRLSDIFSSAREHRSQGQLYLGIEDGLGYLSQKYGEEKLFLGPAESQITASDFDLPGLIRVTDLASAGEALQGIVAQGEGARGVTQNSHYGKFFAILEEYDEILKEDPNFVPGRPVLYNPYSMLPGDISDETSINLMEDPLSIDVSNLFDGCYEIMMQMLGRLFLQGGESRQELTKLADITVRLMASVLGPLGEALTTLPAGPSYPGLRAGPSFRFSRDVHTPPSPAAAWELFIERLKELSAYTGFIQSTEGVAEVLGRVSRALSGCAEQLDNVRQQT
jgi:hypothetical protein